jgi:hypothetical protein
VIDEGREAIADATSNVIPADQVPECQGCHKKAAQFVCAGCGNQWYCSRECQVRGNFILPPVNDFILSIYLTLFILLFLDVQVQAWEEHSEMCSG